MSKDTPAASGHVSDRHVELKEVALAIFVSEVKGKRSGFTGEKIALESFRLAREFLECSDAVELGEASAERPKAALAEWVDVDLWVQVGDKWVPELDQHRRPVKQKMLMDPDSFAPNLPAGHPINQRSGPAAKLAHAEAVAERLRSEAPEAMDPSVI